MFVFDLEVLDLLVDPLEDRRNLRAQRSELVSQTFVWRRFLQLHFRQNYRVAVAFERAHTRQLQLFLQKEFWLLHVRSVFDHDERDFAYQLLLLPLARRLWAALASHYLLDLFCFVFISLDEPLKLDLALHQPCQLIEFRFYDRKFSLANWA